MLNVLPIVWEFYVCLCFVMHYFMSINMKRKRKLVALLLLSYRCLVDYKCSVDLPHGTVSWSAVCDCGIS